MKSADDARMIALINEANALATELADRAYFGSDRAQRLYPRAVFRAWRRQTARTGTLAYGHPTRKGRRVAK